MCLTSLNQIFFEIFPWEITSAETISLDCISLLCAQAFPHLRLELRILDKASLSGIDIDTANCRFFEVVKFYEPLLFVSLRQLI